MKKKYYIYVGDKTLNFVGDSIKEWYPNVDWAGGVECWNKKEARTAHLTLYAKDTLRLSIEGERPGEVRVTCRSSMNWGLGEYSVWISPLLIDYQSGPEQLLL